jgi:hypothetical protein
MWLAYLPHSRFKTAKYLAVTGYFLGQDQEYQEILLDFEPLSGTHSGVDLSDGDVILRLLQQRKIMDQVFAETTDNALNNTIISTSKGLSSH